ncbi:MAG: phosphotransferase [Spirochaetaceae bacterium]|nr:phosphotransferase [Spirochaetaceae bacterium]
MPDPPPPTDDLARRVRALIGREPASIEPVAAGLGSRRFFRVRFETGEPRTLVARLEPERPARRGGAEPEDATGRRGGAEPEDAMVRRGGAEPEDAMVRRAILPEAPVWLAEPPLEPLRGFLESAGLPVPRSAGREDDGSLELLEDVGSRTLRDVPDDRREALYREACTLVPRLQRLEADPSRIPAFGRVYDRALVETKGWKWLHWTLPGLLGRPPDTTESERTRQAFERLAECVLPAPRRLAHRDFKAENLHWRPASDTEAERLVMIDVQGAFMAPPEYDLVCLLYDLQVDLPESLVRALLVETRAQLPDAPPAAESDLRFDALATLRLAKDVSHVVHAGLVRGDRRRWSEIPRGLALLGRAAGRLESRIPELRALTSVIQTLTQAAESADSSRRGRDG